MPWPTPPCRCPDGASCLHGLCSLAASCTQMYCSVFVNRLKILWCCSSEGWEFREAGKEAGVRRPLGSGVTRRHRATDGSPGAVSGAGCKDRQTDSTSPQHCCPAVLLSCCPAQLSLRCQLSSHHCSRCVRDVTRNTPGLCASLLKRNFCLFHSISVLGVVMQGPVSCRVLSPPGTAPQSAGVTPSAGPLC